jgi:hypothetical protein
MVENRVLQFEMLANINFYYYTESRGGSTEFHRGLIIEIFLPLFVFYC